MFTDPVKLLLWHDLAIFLLLGAVLGALLGLLLIFSPQYMQRLNRVANLWMTTRRFNRWLERSVSIENWFYQHHRAVGVVVVLAAIYILIFFGVQFDKVYTMQHLSWRLPAKQLGGLLDALVLTSLVSGAVAFIVGLFLWLRPSMLRGMEEDANQWVSSRRATKILDVPRAQVDQFVIRHAQKVGWLMLLGSIYLLFVVLRLLV